MLDKPLLKAIMKDLKEQEGILLGRYTRKYVEKVIEVYLENTEPNFTTRKPLSDNPSPSKGLLKLKEALEYQVETGVIDGDIYIRKSDVINNLDNFNKETR